MTEPQKKLSIFGWMAFSFGMIGAGVAISGLVGAFFVIGKPEFWVQSIICITGGFLMWTATLVAEHCNPYRKERKAQ